MPKEQSVRQDFISSYQQIVNNIQVHDEYPYTLPEEPSRKWTSKNKNDQKHIDIKTIVLKIETDSIGERKYKCKNLNIKRKFDIRHEILSL